jgi:DNA-directed RNA polymerase specialized sigma24 family protein
MIIDDSRSLRFRSELSSLDWGEFANPAGADEVNASLDRLLIGEALARLSAAHRAAIRRSSYLRWTTAQIAQDLHIPEGTVKSRVHSAVRALRVAFNEMGVTHDDLLVAAAVRCHRWVRAMDETRWEPGVPVGRPNHSVCLGHRHID